MPVLTEQHLVANAPVSAPLLHARISPTRGRVSLQLKELWKFRELIYFLTWRDIKVRYKQTALGVAWAILQPLLTMLVFSLFFGRLAKVPSDGIPYPVFALTGLVPWTFFSLSLTQSSNSLVTSANLIKKIYFPRLAIPIATVLAGIIDFALAFAFLLVAMLYFGITPTWRIVCLPVLVLLTVAASLGVGLWLSAFNVKFRDVRYALPFLSQFWMIATPVAYPSSLLKEPWQQTLYSLNPMVGVVEGFRWVLLGTATASASMVIVSSLVALGLLLSGAYYFRHMERTFADVI